MTSLNTLHWDWGDFDAEVLGDEAYLEECVCSYAKGKGAQTLLLGQMVAQNHPRAPPLTYRAIF